MSALRYIMTAALLAAVLAPLGCNGAGSSTIGRSAVSVAQESRAESGRHYALGPQFESQLEQMISREVAALGGKEGVPMELNRQVLLNINYFLNTGRGFMITGLSRGSKYIPMMKGIFRQKGLPEDLVYLALIESGFKTDAVSHAAAVGPWQFIASTGRRYGLTINDWVDERRDPVKSTYAAADYLTTLHDMFNSWPLAIAAYNSGEGKIMKGLKDYGVSNFWDMSSAGDHLADETKLYVPSFLAVTFIAKDPAAYGLSIENQPPDQWDEIVVPAPLGLKEAAKFSGSSVERLKELNPHLKKEATPPGENDFVLRVPAGSSAQFAKAYERSGGGTAYAAAERAPTAPRSAASREAAAAGPRLSTITHKVQTGDTLGSIARLYGVSIAAIQKNNGLSSNLIKRGQILKIQSDLPLTAQQQTGGPLMVVESPRAARSAASHTVVKGETLSSIALKYGMSVRELADRNKIEGVTIRVGQKLTVNGAAASPAPARTATAQAPASGTHTVAAGESLGVIAEKYGLKTQELMSLNGLKDSKIRVGQKLQLAVKGAASVPARTPAPARTSATPQASASGTHTVAAGESLGVIAEKYGLKTQALMDLNGLNDSKIRVGQKLQLAAKGASSVPARTPAPARTSATPQASASGTHTVAAGESLGVIAEKYGLKTQALMDLNGLNDSKIRVGQKLNVSPKATVAPAPAPAPQPVSPPASEAPQSALQGRLERPSADTYKVAEGDTLYSIARKHGLSVDELKVVNGLKDNNLRPGQVLKVR